MINNLKEEFYIINSNLDYIDDRIETLVNYNNKFKVLLFERSKILNKLIHENVIYNQEL